MADEWLLYGAYGYTGELIAREAKSRGLRPILAGRDEARLKPFAEELGLEMRSFPLDDPARLDDGLRGVKVVLHCAGPFSRTAKPMLAACLRAKAHYLDITGEIDVLEHAYALDEQAKQAGIVVCPAVGFDVIPTDCVAATLAAELPDATQLRLGFDTRSALSPGTAKTTVEGAVGGTRVRRGGRLTRVPMGSLTRTIDFGQGEKLAVAIPWGDVASAYRTTGIPDIEVYLPTSPRQVRALRFTEFARPVLRLGAVQRFLQSRAGKRPGPTPETRAKRPMHVWGEAITPGERRVARITTANGYDLTVTGSLPIVVQLLSDGYAESGARTPSQLMGADYVTKLPGSSPMILTNHGGL
ncbi:MAG: NAD(P)H-binding protein [Hamadaea sp.]|uniref:saccharopine dehydrogenase family protein n=1 Tax=Hamadaea sp. TaxID=2024425 RepID=UPI00180AFBB8|nr:saccharopine dehydrogenase NADP-binding domain-containing protein [Hamadaea sp.]NUT22505.1 NAD(P)H-binding protein [Hamadaea sp.]